MTALMEDIMPVTELRIRFFNQVFIGQLSLKMLEILKRKFNVGDKVLLYKSRFRFSPGKLLSKWEGPYLIEEVYHSGAIKINNFEGTRPHVVNGQRHKQYIVDDPINRKVDVIHVVTHEERI